MNNKLLIGAIAIGIGVLILQTILLYFYMTSQTRIDSTIEAQTQTLSKTLDDKFKSFEDTQIHLQQDAIIKAIETGFNID